MKASLAMVVCFIGFQGIVPEAGSPADATTLDAARVLSGSSSSDDGLTPTGTVGSSLLAPLGTQDALDPLAPRTANGASIIGQDRTQAATVAPEKRPASGTLFAPVADLVPTSSFGFRTSPITGEAGEFHTGQDYAVPCGATVFAADAGTVRAVGWHPWGGGNRVEVDHGNGLITTYNHLQGISVRAGDSVNGGDPIAAIGTSGSSTGCHLHFETILDGEHVDPLRWTLVHTAPGVSKGKLKDFTPGGTSATDIPAWAQSSTRSDQPMPVTDPAPARGGQAVPDRVDTSVVAGPPPVSRKSASPSAPAVPPVTVPPVIAPPVTAVPGPQQAPSDKPLTPNKPESTNPSTAVPGPGHTVKPGPGPIPPTPPKGETVTPPKGETVTPPKGDAPTPPKGETVTPPKGDAPTPPSNELPEPANPPKDSPLESPKPEAPTPPTDETPKPAEPVTVDPALPAPETPAPSCAVDPSLAIEEEDPAESDPAMVHPIVEPVVPAAAPAEAASADAQAIAAGGKPATDDAPTDEAADGDVVSCEEQDPASESEGAPAEGAPGAPMPKQAGDAAVAPAREQG